MPRDRIIQAAVELVDSGGVEALTFRALAERLGSGTATLYRHMADRAELVGEVVDHILGEIDLTAGNRPDEDWQTALAALCDELFTVLARHQHATPLLAEHVPTGPRAMAFREACLAAMLNAGLAPTTAAISAATLGRYTLGFAMQMHTTGDDRQQISEAFEHADSQRYPSIHALAEHLPVPLHAEFAHGIRMMIRGIAATTAENPSG
ncbi:AcrR family transcriptional regulator [Hamadaea flava]|uniref:TetR/AcrR family transcriptional regulator n=1 Tax=Hamadaea flava TaxID=1742688 RepID=A0ABV8LYM8_9ACTN|nr:TetR/AcrR family transcriptional regulator C-terminal domain-containing protein [Hamadaea flava]MCP2323514.1 AcrR family transcriptional regulator [Hamadaea flava]